MKIACFLLLAALFTGAASAQLKSQLGGEQTVAQSVLRPLSAGSILSFFDPNKFSMRQSFSMSYLSAQGSGLSLASYTNSMAYQLADPLNVRFDLTLQGQPFGGGSGAFAGSNLSKLFLSRAELNYQPSKNMYISFQFSQMPYNQWLMSDPFRADRSSMMFSPSVQWGDN